MRLIYDIINEHFIQDLKGLMILVNFEKSFCLFILGIHTKNFRIIQHQGKRHKVERIQLPKSCRTENLSETTSREGGAGRVMPYHPTCLFWPLNF